MTWLAFTALGICIALLIRAALRAVVEHALEDGRWSDDWRDGLIVVGGAASAEDERDLSGCQPHGVAPLPSCRALPLSEAERATPAGAFGLEVREG